MNWACNLWNSLFNDSTPVEQKTAVQRKRRSSLIGRESHDSDNSEHAEMQPEKRQRKMDKSIVIYGQKQGSSSNFQLTCNVDWLSSNSALNPMRTLYDKLLTLLARGHDVFRELEQAESQPGKRGREEVRQWLTLVQGIKDEIQSMINDGEGSSSNSNLSTRIKRFIKEVDELFERGKFPNGLVLSDQENTRLPLLLGMKPIGKNFQKNTAKILRWLRNQERCIIGIYGMGGVGKTTLLMQIHDQLLQDFNLYGRVYWVTVSENRTVHKLQKYFAKVLGMDELGVEDEKKRAAIIHNRLAYMGPTVLIIDDVWEAFSLRQVGIPLEGTRCKIILSTRSLGVCRKIGCKDFVIKAKVLPKNEAWDLYVDKLGHYDTLEKEAKDLARSIADLCGGLPLAIATMASSMTQLVDIHEWQNALNELNSARDQADMKVNVLPLLQYSYDRLNDQKVQNCFLSCVMYEDKILRREMLINRWISQGLLDDTASRVAKLDKGHVILNQLESSCLLESTLDKKCVRMHDLVRKMGIIITQKDPRFIAKASVQQGQVPEEELWKNDLEMVSLYDNEIEEIPSAMSPITPKLKVLLLHDNPLKVIPKSLFVHMRALTILDLSYTNIERVTKSVSDLEDLRELLLYGCKNLRRVPSVVKLTKLRVLDLDECFNLEKAPRGIERLKCLESVGYCPWDVSNTSGFNKIVQSSTSLSCYGFWIRDPTLFKSIHESYVNLSVFQWEKKAVCISGWEFREDETTWLLPNTLELLEIYACDMKARSLGDVFPSLVKATDLYHMNLSECRGLKYIIGTQEGSSLICSQLTYLKLKGSADLRSIIKLGVPGSFSHLQVLNISGCHKMKVVFGIEQVHFPSLRKILVSDCARLKDIFDSNKVSTLNPIISLPNLIDLHLTDLPKLRSIYKGLLLCKSLCVSSPLVKNCPNLKLLPLPKGLICDQSWSSMKFLSGNKKMLETLQRDYPHQASLLSNHIEQDLLLFSNLIDFTGVIQMEGSSFLDLRRLHITNCSKIRVIFPFVRQFNLPKLESIQVEECREVKAIFDSNKATESQPNPLLTLPKLKKMYLKNLPKLSSIYSGILRCTCVQVVDIKECPKLELLPLSLPLLCDASFSTLASHVSGNMQVWRILQRYYPHDARLLCHHINRISPPASLLDANHHHES